MDEEQWMEDGSTAAKVYCKRRWTNSYKPDLRLGDAMVAEQLNSEGDMCNTVAWSGNDKSTEYRNCNSKDAELVCHLETSRGSVTGSPTAWSAELPAIMI